MLASEILARVREIQVRTGRQVADVLAGEYVSVFKGRGMEFDEVRPYQPGDEVRTIDWNVTARMNEPYVKRFVESRELTVMLVVDASGSNDYGTTERFKREIAAELAAVLSFAATNNNDKVGLLIFTDKTELFIPPRKGRRHILRIVREMLAFQPSGRGTNLAHALDSVNRILKRRSIVFLISDFQADPNDYRKELYLANRRHDVIAVDLHDPMDTDIASVGIIALEDAETGEMVLVDTSDRRWREVFAANVDAHESAKVGLFNRAGVDRLDIDTGHDYVDELTLFFQRRERRMRR